MRPPARRRRRRGGLYTRWLCRAWSGKATLLLGALRAASRKAGAAPAGAGKDDPRVVLSGAVRYVENNRERMNYPEYRRRGLPVSSAPWVKGSEKFWLSGGAEAVLQVRTAYLSEDDRAERYGGGRAPTPGRWGGPARPTRPGAIAGMDPLAE